MFPFYDFLCNFALNPRIIMNDTTPSLTPELLSQLTATNDAVVVTPDVAVIRSLNTFVGGPSRKMLWQCPHYAELGRLVIITHGQAVCKINLVPYELREGDAWIIPGQSYMSIEAMTENFDGRVVSFQHLPVNFERSIVMHLDEADFSRMELYFELLWQIAKAPYAKQTIKHLEAAMVFDLEQINKRNGALDQKVLTHGEAILLRFLELLSSKKPLPRNVKAYADRLCVSPNHLSAVIRQQSGRSVMDWLNANCILRAQVMLQYADIPICDVAYRLGFESHTFFSRFFRRKTGLSPKDYRASVKL